MSDGTCLRAHEAFVHITSDRTFCAGGRNGEGPCQGDSEHEKAIDISIEYNLHIPFRWRRNRLESWKEMVHQRNCLC